MAIDWFTILAQALNFLILVWLMKRFLYKPILKAIDAREKRIAAELASADKKKAEAKKESDEFKEKNEQFDQERTALLKKATDDAQTESQRLLDEARKAVLELSTKGKDALKAEEHSLLETISRRIQSEVFAIARKALTDLAGANLEEQMVNVFARLLRKLNGEEKKQLTLGNNGASSPVVVHTSSDLAPAQRTLVESAIKEVFGSEAQVKFEVAPNLVAGIELTANGHKTGWSIADYLTSLEGSVIEHSGELSKEKSEAKPKSKAEPRSEEFKTDVRGKEHGI